MSENRENRLTYQKEGGTGGISGHLFEIKIIMLYYYTALTTKVNNFCIACNIKVFKEKLGHGFDDIGIYWKQDAGEGCSWMDPFQDSENMALYQLKYVDSRGIINETSLLSDNKNPFSLPRYFKWVNELWERGNQLFLDGNYRECSFNFITTAHLPGTLEECMVECQNTLFSSRENMSSLGKYYVFKDNCQKILEALPGGDIEKKKEFVSKLRFYPVYPKEKKLDSYIQDLVAETYDVSLQDVKTLYVQLVDVFQTWWVRTGKAQFLEPKDKDIIWTCCKLPNASHLIRDCTDSLKCQIRLKDNFGIGFEEDNDLAEKYHKDVINITTVKGTTAMSCLKFCQILKFFDSEDDFIKLDLFVLLNDVNIFKLAWYQTLKSILIIVCDHVMEDFQPELLLPLFDKQTNYNYFGELWDDSKTVNRKIVFVDLSSHHFETLQAVVSSKGESFHFDEVKFELNFSSLTKESQEIILSKKITLTDRTGTKKQIRLIDLNKKDLQNIKDKIHVDILWMLMQNETFDVFTTGGVDSNVNVDNWLHQLAKGGTIRPFLEDYTKTTLNLKSLINNSLDEIELNCKLHDYMSHEEKVDSMARTFSSVLGNGPEMRTSIDFAVKIVKSINVENILSIVEDITKK